MTDTREHMRATPGDLRRARAVARFAKYGLLPASIALPLLKVVGVLDWPWWAVLTPGFLYLVHPIVIGALGPLLQYLRYRRQ